MDVKGFLRRCVREAAPQLRKLVGQRRDLPIETWGLARGRSGTLQLAGIDLRDLLAEYGSPLFVVDAARLRENARRFVDVPRGQSRGVECFYSYKTNPVPGVLSALHAVGIGAEVISEYELWLARKLGVPGERIVLNGPGRTPAALRAAVEMGALVVLNHREEIPRLATIARAVGKPARVGLRVVPAGGWSGQFGEPLSDGSALTAVREIAAHPDLHFTALHAHPGGSLTQAPEVRALIAAVIGFGARLRAELGLSVDVVDVGGSLACPTVRGLDAAASRLNRAGLLDLAPPPSDALTIDAYVAEVVQSAEERCRAEGMAVPRLFVEPGRGLTGNVQHLLCRVTGLKASGAPGVVHAILDAGVNIAEPLRNEYHQILPVGPPRRREVQYRLVGPICTPMDTLAWSWRAAELEPGDALAIMDAGAYFVPFSTSFSFPQPGVVMVDGGQTRVLRRGETFEDLVRRDVGMGGA